MANQYLKLRRSSVPGKVPDTASLDFGEIALNTYDGLAFMKKDGPDGIQVVPLGSNQGSFSGSFTGSLLGTSSWAENSITSSYTLSASYSYNTISASYAYTASSSEKSFSSISASYANSSSFAINARNSISSSYANTASFANNSFSSISSSYANTASFAVNSRNAISASYASSASSAINSKNALTASSADNFVIRNSVTASNALVTGTLTAQTLVVTTISSSVIYSSGSNIFGDELTDTQTFTGSVNITGSLSLNGDSVIVSGQTSSMSVLNSIYSVSASNSLTASYVNPLRQNVIISGSLAQGYNVISSGLNSHAEGFSNVSYGNYSHAEGYGTVSSASYSHAEGASTVTVGAYSHTEGNLTVASGSYSHAEGTAYGLLTSITPGEQIYIPTTALGKGSHAEGVSTFARNDGSHAAGYFTSASGLYSNTIGSYNQAGELGNAEGHRTNAGYFENESYMNVAIIQRPSLSLPNYVNIYIGGTNRSFSGNIYRFTSSFAVGDKVVFRKNYYPTYDTASAFPRYPDFGVMSQSLEYYVGTVNFVGINNTFTVLQFTDMVIDDLPSWYNCSGVWSSQAPLGAVANITRPINLSSFTSSYLGDFINTASYQIPIAFDNRQFSNPTPFGPQFSIDPNGSFIGAGSHTEGKNTVSRGVYNHAEGYYTTASGHFSHAEGYYTITNAKYQHAQGQFNMTSSVESAFIIGNGTSTSNRSNLVHAAGNQFQITGSLLVSGSITGSLFGTASWALNTLTASISTNTISASYAATASIAVSSSYALTASYLSGYVSPFPYSGSAQITGSLGVTGSLIAPEITGSLFGTASWALNFLTSSVTSASYSSTASYAINAVSASWANNAITSSIASTAITSSLALTASSAENFIVRNSLTASSALINGTLTAQTLVVQTVSSSVVYSSGSNIFGNKLTDTQTFTGSVDITGSLAVNGSNVILVNQTSSMSVLSASYAYNADFLDGKDSTVFATTGSNTFVGSQTITGSLNVSGSTVQTGNNLLIGNTVLSGSIKVSGSQTFVGDQILTGSFLVSGSTTQDGDNTLLGNTVLSGSIQVLGYQTFNGTQTLTGSFLVSGSTTQVGNNTLLGNTTISGSIIISGSTAPGNLSASVNIYGDTALSGFLRFNPYSTNIDQTISASYIFVSGSTNDLYFSQNGNGYANTTRLRWLEGNLYTGLLNGGLITITTGSTTFNLSSGSGIIVNLNASIGDNPYPTVSYINWGNFTNQPITYRTSSIQTFIGIDSNGQIIQQTSPFNDGQYNTSISIGTVLHQNQATVNGSITYPNVAYGWKQRSYDFVKAFGPLKLSGYTLAASGSSTGSLVIGSGTAFADGRNYQVDPNNPSYITDQGTNVSKIFRYYQSGSTFVQDTNNALGYLSIDPTNYNPNASGSLTPVPGTGANRQWTIQRVFWYPNSATKGIVVYYGNATYTTQADAIANLAYEPFNETPNTQQNAIYIGALIVRNDAVFTDPASYKILPGGIFRNVGGSGGGGSIVTQTLSGLSDVNISGPTDHQPLAYDATLAKWTNQSNISASIAGNAETATTASYALTASHVNNLDLFRIFTGSVEARVDINPNSVFLIKSGSFDFLNISSSGDTTLTSNLFIVKNVVTQQPVLTVSQSIVKIATHSFDPNGTTEAGSIWFTSTAMYIGLE